MNPMGFEPMTNRLKVYCSTSWAKDSRKDMYPKQCFWVHVSAICTLKLDFGYILSNGGPSLTWTVDKTIMSRLLWPTELKGRNGATCRTWTHNQLFTKQLHSHCAKVANWVGHERIRTPGGCTDFQSVSTQLQLYLQFALSHSATCP